MSDVKRSFPTPSQESPPHGRRRRNSRHLIMELQWSLKQFSVSHLRITDLEELQCHLQVPLSTLPPPEWWTCLLHIHGPDELRGGSMQWAERALGSDAPGSTSAPPHSFPPDTRGSLWASPGFLWGLSKITFVEHWALEVLTEKTVAKKVRHFKGCFLLVKYFS